MPQLCVLPTSKWGNRTLQQSIQGLFTVRIEGKPLKAFVTEFLHTYRATPHATTSVSPAEPLHGKLLNTKLHIRGLHFTLPLKDQTNLKQKIERKQEKTKRYRDQRRGAKPPSFQVSSSVRIRKPEITAKGHSKFTQPFKVVAWKGSATYMLSDGKVWNAIHLALTPSMDSSASTSQHDDACVLPSTSEPPETVQSPPPSPRVPRARRVPVWCRDYVT